MLRTCDSRRTGEGVWRRLGKIIGDRQESRKILKVVRNPDDSLTHITLFTGFTCVLCVCSGYKELVEEIPC